MAVSLARAFLSTSLIAGLFTMIGACAAPMPGEGEGETSAAISTYSRQQVYSEVQSSAHAPRDLLSASVTDIRLVNAVGWLVDNGAPSFYISAIRSDHHNDGQSAHAGGHCADMYVKNQADAKKFIALISRNPYVAEVGLGGAYKSYRSSVTKPYFNDNGQTHVHMGVIHAFGSGGSLGTVAPTPSDSTSGSGSNDVPLPPERPTCTANGVSGICVSTSSCAASPGYVSTPGFCSGGNDIQCCTLSDPSASLDPSQPTVGSGAGGSGTGTGSSGDGNVCFSNTLGSSVAELTCVLSNGDGVYEQCHEGSWYRGVDGTDGPFGTCVQP